MALTLPYPGMSFVPLDVLTAAEQNQLVANIEYISNQFPLGASNLANNSVTLPKIDFSTFSPTRTNLNAYFNSDYTLGQYDSANVTIIGNFAIFNAFCTLKPQSTVVNLTIMNLPDGAKPDKLYYLSVDGPNMRRAYVYENGNLQVETTGAISSGTYCTITGVYYLL